MPRMPDLEVEALDGEQRRVYQAIASGPRGAVPGPLRVWLRSPQLADRAQALGAFCRFGTSLPVRLSELAILVTAASWRAGFEWHAHAPLAVEAGLDPAVVEAIRTGAAPPLEREDDAAVYAFARELTETRRVSDATYQRAAVAVGQTALVDLVGILGYYTLISMTINAFDVPLPPEAPEPFS